MMNMDPSLITSNAGWEAMGVQLRRAFLHDCPNCGSKNLWGPYYGEGCGDIRHPEWRVACNSCPVEMISGGELPNDLFNAWNTRTYNIDVLCDLICADDEIRLMMKLKYGDTVTTTHWNKP